jgi:hypothetical protein
VLAAAAQVTRTIKLGTGVALIQQRDAIQTAKLIASIDQVTLTLRWREMDSKPQFRVRGPTVFMTLLFRRTAAREARQEPATSSGARPESWSKLCGPGSAWRY